MINNNLQNYKQTIIDSIPIHRSYRLYVYDILGHILFKKQWSIWKIEKLYDCDIVVWNGLNKLIDQIKILYPDKLEELINHLFTEVMNSLIR